MAATTHSAPLRRITANLPAKLLKDAMKSTEKGITETIVEGLELIRRRRAYQLVQALRGKIHLNVDIDESRGRDRS